MLQNAARNSRHRFANVQNVPRKLGIVLQGCKVLPKKSGTILQACKVSPRIPGAFLQTNNRLPGILGDILQLVEDRVKVQGGIIAIVERGGCYLPASQVSLQTTVWKGTRYKRAPAWATKIPPTPYSTPLYFSIQTRSQSQSNR